MQFVTNITVKLVTINRAHIPGISGAQFVLKQNPLLQIALYANNNIIEVFFHIISLSYQCNYIYII